jgi:uncharacterized protein DUF3574
MARETERSRALIRRRALGGFAVTVGALVLALASGAIPGASSGCAERVQERLFFGLDGPEGSISDAEWEAFVEGVVTPRFPAGLTVLEATGQWRGRNMSVNRESSRVVEIIHDPSGDASRRIRQIASEYKARYQQDSVLIARTRVQVCI